MLGAHDVQGPPSSWGKGITCTSLKCRFVCPVPEAFPAPPAGNVAPAWLSAALMMGPSAANVVDPGTLTVSTSQPGSKYSTVTQGCGGKPQTHAPVIFQDTQLKLIRSVQATFSGGAASTERRVLAATAPPPTTPPATVPPGDEADGAVGAGALPGQGVVLVRSRSSTL